MIHPNIEPAFCQFCGGTVTPADEGSAYLCVRCRRTTYLNSKPSACAVVVRDGLVLLVSDSATPPISWDVPGGFLHYGEPPEEGLRREVREELGVDVSVGELLAAKIDLYGPEPQFTLNLFYTAELMSDDIKTGAEVKSYGWFDAGRLPELKYRSTYEVLTGKSLPERK